MRSSFLGSCLQVGTIAMPLCASPEEKLHASHPCHQLTLVGSFIFSRVHRHGMFSSLSAAASCAPHSKPDIAPRSSGTRQCSLARLSGGVRSKQTRVSGETSRRSSITSLHGRVDHCGCALGARFPLPYSGMVWCQGQVYHILGPSATRCSQ
ncbi:uncharacterized protein B0I36DRAFT_323053 [Microdochium trichocladiopsis]|uniref:Uncharacterized protein n=1 Tax=Microdochium trichocladiopsis TaxID=1682393 RepID=A0A9P8Y7A1_9PEZI|nr:uncharacterized protein B0I36DRAFT_323053 [Microdochium trichocladiopsis]KAH7031028.1 hypothetical protein B0I36DRAFT_323053 [Microdochium trichocladiopsis]